VIITHIPDIQEDIDGCLYMLFPFAPAGRKKKGLICQNCKNEII
jgi:hypothetical protein